MSDSHIEYARAYVALWRVKLAVAQLTSARAEISVTTREDHPAVRRLDAALLAAAAAQVEVEAVLSRLRRAT